MSFLTGERRRKAPRENNTHGRTTTLLPLSYTTSPSKYQSPLQPAARWSPRRPHYEDMPTTPTCHNFLLGGTYIPGKDKRRKHLQKRKKTSGWLGVSLLVRVTASTLLIIYVVRSWIWPNLMGRTPQRQDRKPAGWWWNPSSSDLHLKDRSTAQTDAKRLQREQNRLAEENKANRYAALEKLSPKWFHRDVTDTRKQSTAKKTDTTNNQKGAGIEDRRVEETDKRRTKRKSRSIPNADQKKEPATNIERSTKAFNPQDSLANHYETHSNLHDAELTGNRPDRTLENMHLYLNMTTCPRQLDKLEIATTLVIQTSLGRSWVLDETCKRWTDPIVLVLALTHAQTHSHISTLVEGWAMQCPQMRVILYKMTPSEEQDPALYPVNRLRNIGLDHVNTSHVLTMDVDFVPSNHLAQDIREAVLLREKIRALYPNATDAADREAIVVPAFERTPSEPCLTDEECQKYLQSNSSFIPHDFESLRDCVRSQSCNVFQLSDNWEGHYSTKSEKWLAKEWYSSEAIANSDLKDLKRIRCFDTMRYEPYVAIRWCPASQDAPVALAPFYDERFHGYGKNKIEYIQHLRFTGYQFSVLPKGFIVHNPHVVSKSKEVWNDKESHSLHKAMDALYPKFLKELFEKFKDAIDQAVGLCKG